jgi:phosphopantothenoylcysteine decarboxylase/phosphopantothenate--cysteine ligase
MIGQQLSGEVGGEARENVAEVICMEQFLTPRRKVATIGQPMDHPEVVITAGGTQEKIDDVRYVGNFSGGRLGHELARSYAQLGHRVLLLAPERTVERLGLPDGVEHRPFGSAASLRGQLLTVQGARLVLNAAAISDYTPEPAKGKISSDQEELTITLRRSPKILPELRSHFGSEASIVGFKLLSGVSEEALIEAAVKQMADSRTDMCVANDLEELGKDERRIHIVRPDGSYSTIWGSTQVVAYQIAQALKPKI